MDSTDDLASRTDTVIQGIGILDIKGATLFAVRKIEFVVIRKALQQVPCPFETQSWLFMEQQVGFVSAAKPVTKFDVGARPTGVHAVMLINTDQEPRRKKCDERRRLNLILRILDESCNPAWRFTTSSFDAGRSAVAKVSRVQFSNSVVGQSGTFANRAGSCFVANHSKREFELAAFS